MYSYFHLNGTYVRWSCPHELGIEFSHVTAHPGVESDKCVEHGEDFCWKLVRQRDGSGLHHFL